SVELKVTVPDTDRASAVSSLGMDVLETKLRQVVFFDTPGLRLTDSGVVVRVRRMPRGGDAVIKLRPIVPADLPRKLRRSPQFSVQIDAMPGAFICSGSLRGSVDNADVIQMLKGKRPIRKLFTKEQRALYEEYAPPGLDLDSLTAFGPINVAKL